LPILTKILAAATALFSLWLIGHNREYTQSAYPTSYWIWAGITANDAPANSELYVYQGVIHNKDGGLVYERKGLYPHPIKSPKLYLSYRIEGGLPDSQFTIKTFESTVEKWKRHPVAVSGLQLDFDSPTSKLLIYSNFLREIRQKLPEQYELSITGLGDWALYGDEQVMKSISKHTDEMIFQLYQGRKEIPDVETYINALKKYPLPYRIGLLVASPNNQKYISLLRQSHQFKGVVYFIQKGL
jgi:hypothetical protein